MKKVLHIGININSGFSGRAIQIQKLINYTHAKHSTFSVYGDAKNSNRKLRFIDLLRLLKLFIIDKENDIYIFHGWWMGCLLIPLLTFKKKIIFQSTCIGYDDFNSMKIGLKKICILGINTFIEQGIPQEKENSIVYSKEKCNKITLPNISDLKKDLTDAKELTKGSVIHSGVISKRKRQIASIFFLENIPYIKKVDFYGPYNENHDSDENYVRKFNLTIDNSSKSFYRGVYTPKELPEILKSYEYFCVSSLKEGMSNFYIECLVHGLKPIILPGSDIRLFKQLDKISSNKNYTDIFFYHPIEVWNKILK
ncbi:hypothetical protein [Vibrio salinus]|uniref:hypothetical protein n=1 Tax=Vibrio salinus TaxID=2899784 RepID=UPI001E4E7B54|nr:hypothetical protein [Vibrio salinus]MCE0493804.1 hypothetical protein [Vibrio salinus]